MLRFAIRRLVMLIVTLLVSSFVVFSALYISPGSPLSTLSGGRTLPPAAVAVLEHRYHLNDPFFVRYWHWLTAALHGSLGDSIALRESVSSVIGQHVAVTAELVLFAALIVVAVGIGLGLLAGLKRGPVDTVVVVGTTVLAAVPSFIAAVGLISGFAGNPGWVPALG